MTRRLVFVATLGLSACLAACEPAEPEPGAAQAPAKATGETPSSVAIPPPTYPKATAAGTSEAFYPLPIPVHRCLNLAANGPADQVEAVCRRALALDPTNQEIRDALTRP